ncbi:MAG TPA: hypothetical protein DCP89_04995 [Acidimicrobiaceae bacterium]|jgi:hypothetical protein|nr:hypothetical protein [Actinomycetota bacterium]NCG40211.1 hypothetical protein [Actinomycetota bacterium]HAN07836.1 hypothetical protein [Acidimicrobiaceae bacterium]
MEHSNFSTNDQIDVIQALAGSTEDTPVLMLNINRYTEKAGFPNGDLYKSYMQAIEYSVGNVGGSILWRRPISASVVGDLTGFNEVLGVWYPSHQSFVDLPKADGAKIMFSHRKTCVEVAHILAMPDSQPPSFT